MAEKDKRRLAFERLEDRKLLAADPIVFWNDVALHAVLDDSRIVVADQAGATRVSRALAISHVAMYDAWNGIARQYVPYLVHIRSPRGASGEAAVAQAAHDALSWLYPSQRTLFDAALRQYLGEVPDGKAERLGVLYGKAVARAVRRERVDDGAEVNQPYQPGTQPGQHRADPLNPGQGYLTPAWGQVRPFADGALESLVTPAFPSLDSAAYAAAFEEVRVVGAQDAEVRDRDGNGLPDRTEEQTEIGIFWAYDHRLGTPLRLYNQAVRAVAVQQGNTVSENSRLFALVNVALADAMIQAWKTKYEEDIWRPIVAIRQADSDGNPNTVAESDWRPLGSPGNNGDPVGFPGQSGPDADPDPLGGPDFTPPFPSYTAGHAVLGAAAFDILSRFYGTDAVAFSLYSEDSGTTRTFRSFSQAAQENDDSRLYLGVHWRPDCEVGNAQGRAVADAVFARLFQEHDEMPCRRDVAR